MTLHRRPVAALTTLSYASKPTTSIQLYQVPPAGVEPATHSLRVNCSNHLSYKGLSSPGPLARAHAQCASGGTVRAAVCEGIQRPACLHYHPRSPSTRPASHVRLARQARQQTRVWAVQPRVTVDDNALWAVQDSNLRCGLVTCARVTVGCFRRSANDPGDTRKTGVRR